jgi:hypothetical protein
MSSTQATIEVSELTGVETGDPLKCRIGANGPNCQFVWQAARLGGGIAAAARELGISRKAAKQAVAFYKAHPPRRDVEEVEWERLGLMSLMRDDLPGRG